MVSGLVRSDTGSSVPLCSVQVQALAARGVVQHELSQTYVNTGRTAIETEYVFPLPESASISGFLATFASGRRVTGRLKERGEAQSAYQEAVRSGTRAALLEELRPDVFRASVGNLGPGEEIVVTLRYCAEVSVEQDALRMTVPSHVAPRYAPPEDYSEDTRALVHPPSARQALLSIEVVWETGCNGVERLESPTHPLLLVRSSEEPGKATAVLEGESLESDVVLLLKPANLMEPVVMWEEWHGSQALMLSLVPKFRLPRLAGPEVAFVIDCSGSMQGARLEQAKRALRICVQSLPPDASLNVVKFGATFEAMAPRSMLLTNDFVHEALRFVDGLLADMGGTELVAPLQFACAAASQVLLLTDGRVANEQRVIEATNGHGARVFALGIGSGVSTFLLQGLARATQGYAAFVQDGEPLEPVCAAVLQKALAPAISNLQLAWPAAMEDDFVVVQAPRSFFEPQQQALPQAAACEPEVPLQAPARPSAIFADGHFCAFALYPSSVDPAGEVRITGESPEGKLALSLAVPASPTRREEPLLHRMAARALIRDAEDACADRRALELSLRYSVLCRGSAFVAVDERGEVLAPPREAEAKVPQEKALQEETQRTAVAPRPGRPPALQACCTSSSCWRAVGIVHKRNEFFLDVVERLTCLVGADGSVLRADVRGSLKAKCHLSGMPELKLTFNEVIRRAERLWFHQSARMAEGTLSLVPPDGEFELASYEARCPRLPFDVKTAAFLGRDGQERVYEVRVKCQFKVGLAATDVEFVIPLEAESLQLNASAGVASFHKERGAVTWQLKRLRGGEDLCLTATCSALPKQRLSLRPLANAGPPIAAHFRVPLAASGLEVRHLKVSEKGGYQVAKHLRFITEDELCQYKLPVCG